MVTHDPHARRPQAESAEEGEESLGGEGGGERGGGERGGGAPGGFSLNLDELMQKARQAGPEDGTGDPALCEAWDDAPDGEEARTLRASAYVEGDMEPEARARFEEELARDPALRDEVERLRRTLVALDQLGRAAPSEAFLTSVEGKIRQRSRGRFFGEELFPTRFPFEAVVGSVLVVLAALYLYARHTERDPATFEAMSGGQHAPDAGHGDADHKDAGHEGQPAAPQGSPSAPRGASGEAAPAVLELRQQVARYTLVLRAGGPDKARAGQDLAQRVRATHRAWEAEELSPGVLEVRVPAGSEEDFLKSFGAGGEVRTAREVLPAGSPPPDKARIRVELVAAP